MVLTLLHSEQPKLCGVLAVLSATGLKGTVYGNIKYIWLYFDRDFPFQNIANIWIHIIG